MKLKLEIFYGVPKIHKSNHIKTAIKDQNQANISTTEPLDLKLLPILAGPAWPAHRLSNFVDILLKNICEKVPSYIRDSMDFLNRIPETTDPNTLLVYIQIFHMIWDYKLKKIWI